jgi:hypothetical protein
VLQHIGGRVLLAAGRLTLLWHQPGRATEITRKRMAVVKHFRNPPPSPRALGTKLKQENCKVTVVLMICTLSISYMMNYSHDKCLWEVFNLSMSQYKNKDNRNKSQSIGLVRSTYGMNLAAAC